MTKVILILILMFLKAITLYSFTNCGMNIIDSSMNGFYFFNDSLEKLKYNYVNFVGINLFIFQNSSNSSIIYKDDKETPLDNALESVIDLAQNKGMKIFLKVNVNSKDGVWRGYFNPTNINAWFNSYSAIRTQYAQIAENKGIELFSIGCELTSLQGDTCYSNWTNVINAIKDKYTGKLVYSADWKTYTNVSFWEELDYIGIDAYFPLDTDNNATAEDIKNDWRSCNTAGGPYGEYYGQHHGKDWVARISNFCASKGKKVFFTEIGYSSANGAAYDPAYYDFTSLNLTLQSNCYRGTFMVWTNQPCLEGMFWWDWQKSPYGGGPSDTHHTPMNKPAETVLKEMYGAMVSYTLTNTNVLVIIPTPHYPVNIKVNTNKPEFIWSNEGYSNDFDWEDETLMGWYPCSWDQSFNVYPFHTNTTDKVYSGNHSLKCHLVLTQGHSLYDRGVLWFDLSSSLDLQGRIISVAIWVPPSMINDPCNELQFVFKDSSYQWYQGNGHDITVSDTWVKYQETLPSTSSFTDIKYLGIKIGCGVNNTKFDGYIYIDAYDFGEGNKYWLQVSDTLTFSSTILNIPDIPSINYMPSSPITKTGTLYWRIRAKSFEGWHNWSNPVSFQMDVSTTTKKESIARYKSKAYPNPCPRDRNITFEYGYASDKEISDVTIEIYDIIGNKIFDKTSHPSQTGKIVKELKNNNNEQIIPGLYIYRIIVTYTGGVKDTIKFKKIVICD